MLLLLVYGDVASSRAAKFPEEISYADLNPEKQPPERMRIGASNLTGDEGKADGGMLGVRHPIGR